MQRLQVSEAVTQLAVGVVGVAEDYLDSTKRVLAQLDHRCGMALHQQLGQWLDRVANAVREIACLAIVEKFA